MSWWLDGRCIGLQYLGLTSIAGIFLHLRGSNHHMSTLPTYVIFLWKFYYFDNVPRNLYWFELLLQEGELTITTFYRTFRNFSTISWEISQWSVKGLQLMVETSYHGVIFNEKLWIVVPHSSRFQPKLYNCCERNAQSENSDYHRIPTGICSQGCFYYIRRTEVSVWLRGYYM